jgi:hypothetical protein
MSLSESMTFQELRISFQWVEDRPDAAGWNQALPAAFLQSDADYANRFDAMLNGTSTGQPPALNFTPPWPTQPPLYPHFFWRFYLEEEPESVSGKHAFRKLVPFRTGFPVRLRTTDDDIRVIKDGFVFPHAIAVVLTLRLFLDQQPWPASGVTPTTALKRAIAAYRTDAYRLEWEDGSQSAGTLATGAGALLDHLRREIFGDTSKGNRSPQPFIVASVIRGAADKAAPPPPNQDAHKALQGLCTLDDSWQSNDLTPFAKSLLHHRKTTPASHVVYQTDEARAIWFPVRFSTTSGINRTISCYQRNLVLLHLQVRSMLNALKMRSGLVKFDEPVPPQLDVISRGAARELGDLYSGATYRSMSTRAYLEAHPLDLALTEAALKSFGMVPLSK